MKLVKEKITESTALLTSPQQNSKSTRDCASKSANCYLKPTILGLDEIDLLQQREPLLLHPFRRRPDYPKLVLRCVLAAVPRSPLSTPAASLPVQPRAAP